MELNDKILAIIFGIMIGMNIGGAIGWYYCKKFKGNIEDFMNYLENYNKHI
jgi:hypothetical protein